jgi:EAL domain-containing protein (putative c-di-GMP-specific phosphodiesterase class I)
MAKEKGRNRVHAYHPKDKELVLRHGEMEWVARIRGALATGRLCLFAQDIVAVSAGAAVESRAEVLLRMVDENGRLVPPMAFIPAAERYNLMPAIDRWVVRAAFERVVSLPSGAVYTVNLSGASIGDERFLDFIRAEFERTGLAHSAICFEITETAAIGNLARATQFIAELRAMGCEISLDDFGAGMSSFRYLKHLPVDFIKIDGGFVTDMLADPIDHATVEAINRIGHVMGKRTIAESVENGETLEALRAIGVDYAQGFGVARPRPFVTPSRRS